jgi:hypothetical protein
MTLKDYLLDKIKKEHQELHDHLDEVFTCDKMLTMSKVIVYTRVRDWIDSFNDKSFDEDIKKCGHCKDLLEWNTDK